MKIRVKIPVDGAALYVMRTLNMTWWLTASEAEASTFPTMEGAEAAVSYLYGRRGAIHATVIYEDLDDAYIQAELEGTAEYWRDGHKKLQESFDSLSRAHEQNKSLLLQEARRKALRAAAVDLGRLQLLLKETVDLLLRKTADLCNGAKTSEQIRRQSTAVEDE